MSELNAASAELILRSKIRFIHIGQTLTAPDAIELERVADYLSDKRITEMSASYQTVDTAIRLLTANIIEMRTELLVIKALLNKASEVQDE